MHDWGNIQAEQELQILREKRDDYLAQLADTEKYSIEVQIEARAQIPRCLELTSEPAERWDNSKCYRPGADILVHDDLWAHLITAMRDRWSKLPERIQRWLDKIRSTSPNAFKRTPFGVLVSCDRNEGQCLAGEIRFIREFPENLVRAVAAIEGWEQRNGPAEYSAKKPPAMTPPRISYSDPNEPYVQRWDARTK